MACPYFAAFHVTRAFLPALTASAASDSTGVAGAHGGGSGGGHVLNVTSAAGYSAWKGSASYGAARWAMRGFSDFLRCEVTAISVLCSREASGWKVVFNSNRQTF